MDMVINTDSIYEIVLAGGGVLLLLAMIVMWIKIAINFVRVWFKEK